MNSDQLIGLLIQGVINGVFLMIGMIIGTKLTAKSVRRELDDMLEESETLQAIRKFVTDQKLTGKATEFFEEATKLVSSPEAKNFFKNISEMMRTLSRRPAGEMPPPPKDE